MKIKPRIRFPLPIEVIVFRAVFIGQHSVRGSFHAPPVFVFRICACQRTVKLKIHINIRFRFGIEVNNGLVGNIRIGCPIARLNGQNIRFVMLGFTVRTVVFHLAYNMIADTVFVRKPAVKLQFVGRWDNGACKETIRIYSCNYNVAGRILFDFFGR